MKPISRFKIVIPLIKIVTAQSPFFTMSKEWVLGIYSNILESQADSELAKLFAKGIKQKADMEGVPEHIHESVMAAFLGQTRNSNNCPPGGCAVPLEFSQIWNYGCWCNFDDKLTEGKGLAVDDYDSACQKMQLCLRCAEMDSNVCFAQNTSYTAEINLFTPTDLIADCQSQNAGDSCKTHLCACQTQFVSDVLSLLWDASIPRADSTYKHDNGFSSENECGAIGKTPIIGGGAYNNMPTEVPTLTECCGLYPRRAPYNHNWHSCCTDEVTYGKLYNPLTQNCCDDILVVDGPTC